MYNSGTTISALISQINGEADVVSTVGDAVYLRWINTVQQLLYGEFIEDFRYAIIATSGDVDLTDITVGAGEAPVAYDDVIKIYTGDDKNELTRGGAITAVSIPDKDIYYYNGTVIKIVTLDTYDTVTVIYRARPKVSTATTDNIYLPYEWLEMLAAKIRGEIYKVANEDNLAAKWLSDYNAQLESFKVWIAKRNARYGE